MLQFKHPHPESAEPPARWNIGFDRRHVAAYVSLALVAGLAGGLLIARYITRKETATPPLSSEARPPAQQTSTDNALGEFYRVTRIVRADTLDVESIGQVRMIGIETPDGKSPAQIYGVHGQRALSFVEKAVLGQEVRLEFDSTGGRTKDEAGQTLAYVYTRDGTLINAEMVKQGLALVRREPSRLANDFRGYEREAIQAMRGIWGSSSSSGSAAPVAASTITPPPPAGDKPKKLSPLSPSDLGVNIPALTGSASSPGEQSVWVSSGDKMYHKSGCEFLSKKKHTLGLSQAKSEGYTACSRCYASTVLKAP
jgi:micrococcal nuclease